MRTGPFLFFVTGWLVVATTASAQSGPRDQPPPSPLTIHVGDADLLVGGFVDATAVVRSTNVGSGLGTSFGSIPFDTAPQGNLHETRLSAQNSRVSLLATTTVNGAAVKGYVEADFLGAGPANAFVTSNANTLRMRLYWVQYSRGRFEFLGGQSWSLLTPNRTGVSPAPADVFFTQNMDTNYQAGLAWARQAGFRFVAHPSKSVAAAVALENPQQYVGGAVVLPAGFSAAEVDATGNTATPNPYPDVVAKVAFDPATGGTRQHVEVAAVVRGFKTYASGAAASYSATGRGISVNAVLQPAKALRLVATTFISSGGGRYVLGLAPDFVVNANGSMTLVGTKSGVAGVEAQAAPKTLVFGYYGGVRVDRQVTVDAGGRPIGYGIDGATGANRSIDEVTAGLNQTIFRDPRRGALQIIAQYSYLTRTPWSVPAGTPGSARSHMTWFDLRYVLP